MIQQIPPASLFIRINFLLFGFVVLSPFNFVNSILYHFSELYPQHNIPFLVNLPSNAGVLISYVVTFFLLGMTSFRTRMVVSMVAILLSYALVPIPSYPLFMFYLFLSNFFAMVVQSSVYSLAGRVPYEYIRYFNTGTGVCGIYMSLFGFLTLLWDNDKNNPIPIYCFMTTLILLLILQLVFFHRLSSRYSFEIQTTPSDDDQLLPSDDTLPDSPVSLTSTLRQTWFYQLSTLVVFIETFLVFPGYVIRQRLSFLEYWMSAQLVILLFNICDTVAKYLPVDHPVLQSRGLQVGCIYLGRPILMVLFILAGNDCTALQADWLYLLSIILFSFSNGLFCNLMIAQSSLAVSLPREKEISGYLVGAACSLGCMIGSFVGLAIFQQSH